MEPEPSPPAKNALTPAQIGAGVGAAATCLVILGMRDLARPGDEPVSGFMMGVWCAVGALVGLGIGAAIGAARRRSK